MTRHRWSIRERCETATKTCVQEVLDKWGRSVRRRLPHDVPASSESGYALCASCGAEVYVGRG